MTGSRVRWIVVWALLGLWLVALAFDLGGSTSLALPILGIAVLVYELVAEEPESA